LHVLNCSYRSYFSQIYLLIRRNIEGKTIFLRKIIFFARFFLFFLSAIYRSEKKIKKRFPDPRSPGLRPGERGQRGLLFFIFSYRKNKKK